MGAPFWKISALIIHLNAFKINNLKMKVG